MINSAHMQKRFILLTILVLILSESTAQFKVMTYNIRYDNAGDSINQWSNRKEKMRTLLKKYDADIIGFQEALSNQVDDLQSMLLNYSYVGIGRDDGKTKGEYAPVFFRNDKYELLSNNTFWLSPTPFVAGSIGWDAAITRICTWVKLKDKTTGKMFFVFNTHFDHIGDTARLMSAQLIIRKINELAEGLPVIVTGDFNSEPSDKGYKTIIKSKKPKLSDTFSKDISPAASCTFKGFSVNSNICKRIDYIFFSKPFLKTDFKIIDDNDGK